MPKYYFFLKKRKVEDELFHEERKTDRWTDGRMDRQTNMTKLTVAFRYFANSPKNQLEGFRKFSLFYNLLITVTHEFSYFGDNKGWIRKMVTQKAEGKSPRLTSYMTQDVRGSWSVLIT